MVNLIKDNYNNGSKEIALLNMRDLASFVGVYGGSVLYTDKKDERSCCDINRRDKKIHIYKQDSALESTFGHELGHVIHFLFKRSEIPFDLDNIIEQIKKINVERVDKFLYNMIKRIVFDSIFDIPKDDSLIPLISDLLSGIFAETHNADGSGLQYIYFYDFDYYYNMSDRVYEYDVIFNELFANYNVVRINNKKIPYEIVELLGKDLF